MKFNPILAESMRVLGYVNKYNRGIDQVQDELIENRNGKAIFLVESAYSFSVVVQSSNTVGGQIVGQINSGISETLTNTLQLLAKHPTISRRELARILNINESAVQKHIEALKKKNLIKRIGSSKSGYWQIC